MIAFDELVSALHAWRVQQGLPVSAATTAPARPRTPSLTGALPPRPTTPTAPPPFAARTTAPEAEVVDAADAIEEISEYGDLDVASGEGQGTALETATLDAGDSDFAEPGFAEPNFALQFGQDDAPEATAIGAAPAGGFDDLERTMLGGPDGKR